MLEKDALKRMQELSTLIHKYNEAYYQKSESLISDQAFDALYNELEQLEKEFPELKYPSSPTAKVGSDLNNKFEEVPHAIPLLSLDKVYQEEELIKWFQKNASSSPKFSLCMEPKIDGFSVVLDYSNHILKRALSRGNGLVGNNITPNIKTLKNVPQHINSPLSYLIRGEVFIDKDDFEKINNTSPQEYANPRNFAAGVIRRIKSSDVANIPLKIIFYEASCLEKDFETHEEMLLFLQKEGFAIPPFITFLEENPSSEDSLFTEDNSPPQENKAFPTIPFSALKEQILSIEKKRPSLPFDIDGLVFKINDKKLRQSLGETSHHPRWAMAFKFESPKAVSTVLNIITQVGRTGKITPLALLTPTVVNGSTIQKATLHNQDYIDLLELGVGDVVEISKRGEIIPAVEKVLEKKGETFQIPLQCPSCENILIQKGAHLFCESLSCPKKQKGQILYFVQTLKMENFGSSLIELLFNQFQIKTIQDLFTFNYQELLKVEGFKEKKIQNLEFSLKEVIKKTSFKVLLKALGIADVSEQAIGILIKEGINSLSELENLHKNYSEDQIESLHGIGEITAKQIFIAFQPNSAYLKLLKFLGEVGFSLEETASPSKEGILKNSIWVITGTFKNFSPREKAAHLIEELGGKVTSALSSHTSYLLAGDKAGSKKQKAIELGITILNENEFLTKIQDHSSLFVSSEEESSATEDPK